ncbi:COQ9 family protein [Profundibacterium mesophilum]|uniref:COQ9 enzyme domain containing protein n=1 Tax=Profundibacterium mesophilum KAUST100406-0324 TaxID=1037889 RepID=A0A921NRL0_9RHOB|nr:COQ9 family protein [Profundibacterium mesophilum]KAF0676475.1 COQ9 enzyme domain containing protein [Profundibacterium mesophilum KAUST100406-0324]
MTDEITDPRDRLLDAALLHVPFDGWSDATLRAAARDVDLSVEAARALFPRGGVDMALAFHRRGDARLRARLEREPLDGMRFRDRVMTAVRWRIEMIESREAVRRGTALLALPHHAADSTQALWETADHIWTALGDRSDDINWYTKRATLSAVYGATVLYWLGDDSPEQRDSWAFLDRRIEDVMRIETAKARMRSNPVLMRALAGPIWALSRVRAPRGIGRTDLPGRRFGPGQGGTRRGF